MNEVGQPTWCPAITSLQAVVGGKWKIEILFYIAIEDEHRFGQLRRCMRNEVSESTLAKQLKELVEDDFLTRVDYAEVPPRVEYYLTDRGQRFKPILQAMWDWSEAEFPFTEAEKAQMTAYRHKLAMLEAQRENV